MRFKLFLASLLACGFIAFVIAKENISTETESVSSSATNKDKNLPESTVLDKNDAVELFEVVQPQPKPAKVTPKVVQKPALSGNMSRSAALQMGDFYLGELGYDIINDNGYNWGKFKY